MYEDDEEEDDEALPTAFEQDEENDTFGVGTWTYRDGKTRYGKDPELAGKLVARQGWMKDEEGVLRPPEEAAAAEAPTVEEPAVEEPEPEPEPEEEEPPPEQQQPSPAQSAAQAAGMRPAGYQMGSESQSSRTVSGGLPEEMAQKQQDRYVKAAEGYKQSVDDQRFREASRVAARAAQVIESGRMKELEGAAALKQQTERETRAKQRSKEVAETPINSRRAWQEAGAFNKVLGSLAVLLGGLSGRVLGGPNTALQNIKDTMKEDTEDQIANRNSQVAYWTRELGDAQAGVAAAELKKWQGIKERLEGNLKDEESQQILERGGVLLKQIDLEIAQNLNTLEKANYGNEVKAEQKAQSEAASFAVPKPTGSGKMSFKQVLQNAQEMEGRGYKPEQISKYIQEQGYGAPGGESDTEFGRRSAEAKGKEGDAKYSEAEGKAQSAQDSINNFGKKAGLVRNPKTGEWEVGDGPVPPGFLESINPFSDGQIGAAGEAAVEAYGRFQSGGVIGDDERKAFREQLGLSTGNRKQLAARLNAAENTVKSRKPRSEREKTPGAPAGWK